MNKCKKVIAAVISAAILLSSFTACSETKKEQTAETTTETTAQTSSDTSAEETSESAAALETTDAVSEETAETSEATAETEATLSAEITASENDVEGPLTGDAYSEAVSRSLTSLGNNYRIQSVLAKAARGEAIDVCYIGGSITEGLTAGAELCWARLSYERLAAMFPETEINYVNAGMSGTPSNLAVARAERDLIDKCTDKVPDLVFVEFAVNNADSQFAKDSYESLVRRFLNISDETAVALVITVIKSGYTCEKYMSEVGEAYGLPVINLNSVLKPEFEANTMTWEQYSDDESHPNVWGHRLMRDMIMNWINIEMRRDMVEQVVSVPETALFGNSYTNLHLLDSLTLTPDEYGDFYDRQLLRQFPNGWEHKAGAAGIKFTITCSKLLMIFRANKDERFATCDVYVDGELKTSVSSNKSDGWNNPDTAQILNEDEVKTHVIEVRPAEGNEDKYFAVMGFGYGD